MGEERPKQPDPESESAQKHGVEGREEQPAEERGGADGEQQEAAATRPPSRVSTSVSTAVFLSLALEGFQVCSDVPPLHLLRDLPDITLAQIAISAPLVIIIAIVYFVMGLSLGYRGGSSGMILSTALLATLWYLLLEIFITLLYFLSDFFSAPSLDILLLYIQFLSEHLTGRLIAFSIGVGSSLLGGALSRSK